MTRLFDDPSTFMEDMLSGFVDVHSDKVMAVAGGVIRAQEPRSGKVSVVVGGGCGHYPAFAGLVGAGFADGAIVGNIFTSPSAADAYSVGANSHAGGGVVITAGNYAGDVMHFTEAAHQLTSDGISAEVLFVTDDVASAPTSEIAKRRGIAGNFFVFKVLSAAAEEGKNLAEVMAAGRKANDVTRTLGVAFAGCTLPGAPQPLFHVDKGRMAIGLGIHGEPGISEVATPSASELAETLVAGLLPELNLKPGDKVAAILNGLGATKYEELFVVWRRVAQLLKAEGLEVIEPEVGELVTSLDMAGCSLTISKLDNELERYWRASANTPAYRKGATGAQSNTPRSKTQIANHTEAQRAVMEASLASKKAAGIATAALTDMKSMLLEVETYLGEIDAVAGDGDHGRGMAKGITAAVSAAEKVLQAGGGLESVLHDAGAAWATKAGGTSGALWGTALKRIGTSLGNDFDALTGHQVLEAVTQGFESMKELGKAEPGDKTMLDAYLPFINVLKLELDAGTAFSEAWRIAADSASEAAEATASLLPKIGRARPLAEKSVGTPDPGAVSLAMCLKTVVGAFGDSGK